MDKRGIDLGELYKKQISVTEWFENISHSKTQMLRVEDNEKRERLRALGEIIGLPFDEPVQFSAKDVFDRTEKFMKFLDEKGEELCALRLIPLDSSLPKLRMRGKKITDVLDWFNEQKIDVDRYRADFVPHPSNPLWSSIFIINSKGIFGEIIKGGHHQLTQGFHDEGRPIAFSYDFNEWNFGEDNDDVRNHAMEIINWLKVEEGKKDLLREKFDAKFSKGYLQGYFETVKSKEYGTWFIDYNRTLSEIYDDLMPVIKKGSGFLSGQPAGLGKVTGKVRIVDYKDVEGCVLNDDDILVCGVTTPDYFNLMQKAKGIITDGGGALSHAAIIARELDKPCIVGTGNATESLNEGDLIELDADNGVIRKLS